MSPWLERPTWLWWLVPAVAIAVIIYIWGRHAVVRRRQLLAVNARPLSWIRAALGVVGASLFLVAAAGPRWGTAADVEMAHRGDVMLLLDVSRSMLARDATPDRLQRGVEILSALTNQLERRGGWRVGFVVFAGQPLTLCPLTFDLDFVRHRLATVTFDDLGETRPANAVSGTRIGAAITHSIPPGDSQGVNVILVSDGDDPVRDGEWAEGVETARQRSIPITAIGVGDPRTSSAIPGIDAQSNMNEGLLQEIAQRSRGRFFSAKDLDVDAIVRTLEEQTISSASALARSRAPARPTLFILFGLLTLLLAVAPWPQRNVALSSVALVAIAAHPTETWVWRGNQELANNRPAEALVWYQKAEERTPDPGLVAFNKGIALAKLNRWREAELHFRRSLSDAEGDRRWQALYNLGTALVRRSAGRDRQALQDAIAALEQALAMNAESADVKQNLQIAKELLAQAPADSAAPDSADKTDGPEVAKLADAKTKAILEKRLGPANKTGKALNKRDGSGGQETDHPPPPGQGNLPMIPDSDVVERITPEDLAQHLNRAAARIAAAQRDQLKSRRPTSKPNYPDW